MQFMLLRFILSFIFFISLKLNAQFQLSVDVSGIKTSKGKLMFALFNQADGFPDNARKALQVKELQAKKGVVNLKFENLPQGLYAVAVFHDENNDGKLNTNLLGIPKEDYGFSNNARPGFRAPTFNEADFKIYHNLFIEINIR